MSTRRTLRHTWLLIAALAAFACSDTTAPGAGRVASVEIITEQRAFIEGDTLTLSARTLTGDGTPVSDRGPTWSSSNTSVATIAANGRVQALREGRATIRASVDGKADTIEIVVVARAIGAIEFVTPERSLVEGSATTFAARVLDLEGDPMAGRTITWTSGDTTILTATPAGLVTAVRPGKAMLRATVDGNYHAEEITVTPGEVATVDISPAGLQLVEHETRMLTASPRDAAGRLLLDRAVSWSSGNAAIATIAADGRVTARAAGSTHVFAVVADRKDSVLVTVGLAPVGSITVSPTALVAGIGESLQLSAVVRDTAGNVLSGRTILWQTDSPLIATVDQNGVVSGVGPGYATIIASTGGKTFGTAITVTNGEMDLMNHDLLYHRTTPQALGEIMVLPTAAATGPQLLNAGNVSRQPTASPDGRRIAFYVSQVDLTTGARIDDIFAVDRNGMNMKQLTSEPGYDGEPAWSPDGAR
ncbi:MAG TPA: Ig-like domain-containing protein, partial [Gemmatimonadaceae bacterium]|nr:Ig-like domain-containing protein [Gemmatimonadaceae bacterium]